MILILLSLFFCWLIYRELFKRVDRFDGFSIGYLSVLIALAFMCAWPAIKTWQLENLLSEKASIIAERPNIKVKCNSLFDSIFSGRGIDAVAGTAYIETGEIFFEHGWCANFLDYMDDPRNASADALFSMHVFTHEVMHVRGERNEKKTDCQAIQRNHQAGELLGITPYIAKRNARKYYKTLYKSHPYYDEECAPGAKYDERLPNAVWH